MVFTEHARMPGGDRRWSAGALALCASLALPLAAAGEEPVAPYGLPISAAFPYEKAHIEVEGSRIAYVDEGQGQPILFLHGNPTSSYLWRNVLPYVTDGYRAVAADLIGMGDSDKPDIGYTFEDHARYLDGFVEALGLEDIILVVHDWGSALGMRYARLNPDNVAGLAFMEAIVPPVLPAPGYEAMPPDMAEFFRTLRSSAGEDLVLEQNWFVEVVLPEMGVLRDMTEAEMDAYRAPFPTPESRAPVLQWPREIPIAGEPAFATAEVEANGAWLRASPLPKLLFHAEPGMLFTAPVVEEITRTVPNLEVRFLGVGTHYLQEEHPQLIGQGLADWLRRLET
ncbi:MAG: haloalkane dehalogenase [Pseudomonadota bacterium]